jgi:hypothetical protein
MTSLKQYLGDSVYADIEHGMVKLTTENGLPSDPSNTILLEPEIVVALNRYILWVKEQQTQ